MINIYFDKNTTESEQKSENFWSFEQCQKPEYSTFNANRNSVFNHTSLQGCDFVFLPYKWDFGNKIRATNLVDESQKKGKTIISFFNDDYSGSLYEDRNITIFRTSIEKNTPKEHKIMPAFCEVYDFEPLKKEDMSISFCGAITHDVRRISIKKIKENNNIHSDFIIRKGFWAPEKTKEEARREFVQNVRDSVFVLCCRGAGNFSYRFYETLALGRIPVVTYMEKTKFPLADTLNLEEHCIFIDIRDIDNIEKKLSDFLLHKNVKDVCVSNKKLYDEYFSPYGFIKNFNLYMSSRC